MKHYLQLLLATAFLLFQFQSFAQSITVSGKVTDMVSEEPLIGVNVVVEGTQNGAVTDVEGNYTLDVPPDANLVFSYVGYLNEVVPVNNRSIINMAMSPNIETLNEVVVVGYGTQTQRELTTAVEQVDGDEITKTPTAQAMQSIQGKVPGVQIVNSGVPGAAPTVRIRGVGTFGNTEPLYVVDGVFVDNIDFLNTNDIESINILKDASASAIYGVRGANGVVLIETKSGSYNQPAEITYDGYYGVQVAQNVLKMSNSEQFVRYINETGSEADISFVQNAFSRYGRSDLNPNVPNVNTDWYNEVLEDYAPITSHTISFRGGGSKGRYSVSVNYFSQDGLMKNTRNDYERLNLRSKLDFLVTDWLTVGSNLNISNAQQYVGENSVWFKTYFAVPILPVYDETNTEATPYQFGNARLLGYRGSQNPYFDLFYNDNRNNIAKIVGNFFIEAEIIPNLLTFKSQYNYRYENYNSRNVDFAYNSGLTDVQSGISKSNRTVYWQIWDNYLTLNKNFGLHNLNVVGGYSYRDEYSEGIFLRGTEISPNPSYSAEELWYISQNTGGIDDGASGDFGSQLFYQSYFARVSYNYDERYLLYSTFRRDENNKFQELGGEFFTIGAGWVISEESFFDVEFIDFLKLRGGWGQLGNDGIDPAVGSPTVSGDFIAINDTRVAGNIIQNWFDFIGSWERVEETNIGLTARFFEEKLSLSADYFIRNSENVAVPIFLPLVRASIRENKAAFRNTGFELSANWTDYISENLSYSFGGNIATLNNEVTDLGGQAYLDAGQAEFRQRSIIGQPINAFFGYEVGGIFQSESDISNSGLDAEFIDEQNLEPGDFKYVDQNNDGFIDNEDRVVLGSYLPEFTYGFNIGLNWRNISFSANFQGQTGYSILNRKRGEIIFTNDTNIDADLANNLWRGEGTSNIYPSAAGLRKGYNQAMSDYYVEDGSYFRIQNVRLGYTIRGDEKIGNNIPEINIYLTAERPLTVFDYNGFTPEVPSGVDRQTYPIPAVYTLGLNVTL
ncbi:SusC/RagA family TonB-linked outer membrane protein [Mangrovivirga cuniculi]|uniref:TonB-dependent receptor n=1 Tax=Mangrovivirga cuniculi TaxID=2715131 RepID=A0A4D7K8J0_9BACT|nr:TonB-dependent receptor [Mangrovivirga cuniculi]QCK17044.1 TonB-dependent receptor [Mangrovivirga cuniculi]